MRTLSCLLLAAALLGGASAATAAPSRYVDFVGEYALDSGRTLTVSVAHGKLFAQVDAAAAVEFTPAGDATFVGGAGWRLAFTQSANGVVSAVSVTAPACAAATSCRGR